MGAASIRLATPADAGGVRAVYAPSVHSSHASFELDVPTVAMMRQRITEASSSHPWLVCARSNELLGFAYAAPHRARPAYRWSVDVSVYVDEQCRRVGVGRALYTSLLAVLTLQRYCIACAGITEPNPASVALHASLGFERVGNYRDIGFKHGAWRDVSWWQRPLQETLPALPQAPLSLAEARQSSDWRAALQAGTALLGG